MNVHHIGKTEQYVRFLQDNPQEVELLFKELLIGVTSFFRDPEAFELLNNTIVPDIAEKQRQRTHCPGVGTGLLDWRRSLFDSHDCFRVPEQAETERQFQGPDLRDRHRQGRPSIKPARGYILRTSSPICHRNVWNIFSRRRIVSISQ